MEHWENTNGILSWWKYVATFADGGEQRCHFGSQTTTTWTEIKEEGRKEIGRSIEH